MMQHPQRLVLVLLGVLTLLLASPSPSPALLPAVQGHLVLQVDRATDGAFGLTIAPGDTFRAFLEAVSADGSVFPQDGLARVEVRNFFLQIGDTFWDDSMGPGGRPLVFQLLFGDGSVRGLTGEITPYLPSHPDLLLGLPADLLRWGAIDVRTVVDPGTGREFIQDRGAVYGTYTPYLTVVPVPGALGLFGLGLLVLARKRWNS